jgi:hypothetical protein
MITLLLLLLLLLYLLPLCRVYSYIPEKKNMFLGYIVCSCSLFTICATCNFMPMSTMLRTFTLVLSEESVQCPLGLFFVFP